MTIDWTNRYGQGLHSLPIVPMPRTTIAIVVMPGLNLENLHVSVITFLSGQSHNTFVQISLAQDTSWAKTHLSGGGLGLRLGGFSPQAQAWLRPWSFGGVQCTEQHRLTTLQLKLRNSIPCID